MPHNTNRFPRTLTSLQIFTTAPHLSALPLHHPPTSIATPVPAQHSPRPPTRPQAHTPNQTPAPITPTRTPTHLPQVTPKGLSLPPAAMPGAMPIPSTQTRRQTATPAPTTRLPPRIRRTILTAAVNPTPRKTVTATVPTAIAAATAATVTCPTPVTVKKRSWWLL